VSNGARLGVSHYTSVADSLVLVLSTTPKRAREPSILQRMPPRTTKRPFARELPDLLRSRGLTLRSLAREVGGLDHAYLSRMINGNAPINIDHVRRISRHLELGDDYFPELREAEVVKAIREDPDLRDEVFAKVMRRRSR